MKAGNKKNMGATLKRLIAYVLKQYKWQCLLVALCILVSTVAKYWWYTVHEEPD